VSNRRRFLIASRLGRTADAQISSQVDAFLARSEAARAVRSTTLGRRVLELDDAARSELVARHPHLIVEEDQPLKLFPMPGLPDIALTEEKYSREAIVVDESTDRPVPNVTLYGVGLGAGYKTLTDVKGEARLITAESKLASVIASPQHSYWSRVVSNVSLTDATPLRIPLRPLQQMPSYSWGHRLMQFDRVHPRWTGRGVRIALLDSGVIDSLTDFHPAGGLNTLDGGDPRAWNVDEHGHGTHCAGIVAAGPLARGVRGGAPDANLFVLKVFPGGFVSDLVEAVEWCVLNDIDIINMSLGSAARSEVLGAALLEAHEHGVTAIAAVGNDATRVAYPAAFPTVIAVSAIGRYGTFPLDSAHVLKVGDQVDRTGLLFAANFANFGPEVTVTAPGVAVLSTVPSGYAAWDGTSMASPMVTALAGLILETYPWMRTRTAAQPEYVRECLVGAAVDLGLPAWYQGRGLPRALSALSGAV